MKLLNVVFAAALLMTAVRGSPTKRERNSVCKRERRDEGPYYGEPVAIPVLARPSPYKVFAESPPLLDTLTTSARIKRDSVKDEVRGILESSEAESVQVGNRTKITELVEMAKEVDLVFLVDVTGSMSPYIAGVRDSIFKLVNDLVNGTNETETVTDLRIAFVGYRDYSDENEHFTVLPFSNNVKKFHEFVSATPASGGGDLPEDVFGGMQRSQSLEWAESTRTRLVFHIADAPGHGCEYHDLHSDSYAEGDPEGLTAESLFGWYRQQSIQYFFGNITSSTDTMIDRFQEAYGQNITTFDVGVRGRPTARGGGGGGGPYYAGESSLSAAPRAAASIYHSVKAAVGEAVHAKAESYREGSK